MKTLDDEGLATLQREVQRLLGRCLLRVQMCEQLIKYMVTHHRLSGSIDDLEQSRVAQIDGAARKTLGTLVGELLGSYVVNDEIVPPEETTANSPESALGYAFQMSVALSGADFVQAEKGLRELVTLRNNLVHHFVDKYDIWSMDGCRHSQDALVSAYSRIDQHFGQLRDWAEDLERMQQTMSDLSQSADFKNVVLNGFNPDGTVHWGAAGIVLALREAFGALAVDGWAPLADAGRWIATRHPEQLPAKYGCQSWRQVVHKAPTLELRYFELGGQRTACYREP